MRRKRQAETIFGQRDFFVGGGELSTGPLVTSGYLASNGLSVDFPKRFRAKVQKSDGGCWLWTASRINGAYGQVSRGSPFKGMVSAHVASWLLHRGPIPDGLCVLHNCPSGDNTGCVNPGHLWLGTARDNMRDKISKGRTTGGLRGVSRKLSGELAGQIRDLARHRIFTLAGIAAEYPVSTKTIKQTLRGETHAKEAFEPFEIPAA